MGITGRELLRLLHRVGCKEVRQRGSHVRVRCGDCSTTVPVHAGETLPPGTLRQIERDLEPCLGSRWLR
ncbi:MAG: type II toxin-antitoxin system HicA family toxin [Acidobacteriota bacterium]|nr:type II toxin-antitoxin system HicA family toxin [Acidobacteriota bacterium]